MLILLIFSYYLLFVFCLIEIVSSKETIIFAFQINRHGARAPYFGVKEGLDVYKEKWAQIEEISDVGRRMLYLLGVKIRKRYIDDCHLLSQNYNPQEIFIKSTDSNRTIESIYSYIQGLYPNGTGKTINTKIINDTNIIYPPNKKYFKDFENITKQYNMDEEGDALPYKMSALPVHLFIRENHELELYDTRYCFGHKEEYEQRQRRKEILDFADRINEETNNVFMELEPSINSTFLYDYWTLYKYMDCFLCDDADVRNFEYMKEKYGSNILEKLRAYTKDYFLLDYYGTNFPDEAYKIGIASHSETMRSLLNWMDIAINSYKNNIDQYVKFVIFSAHDSTIGALESFLKHAFNIYLDTCPFADSRYFELYVNDNGDYKVRYLKGDNTEKLNILYDDFNNKIMEKIWTNDEVLEYCKLTKNEEKKDYFLEISIMIILVIFNAVLIVFLLVLFFKKNEEKV